MTTLPTAPICLFFALVGLFGCSSGSLHEDQLAAVASAKAADGADCHTVPTAEPFSVRSVVVAPPVVPLVDQHGKPLDLLDLANADRPVALNFIFATCTTICPVMTATFSRARDQLGPDADQVQMVSITIDPAHDTPSVLARYAQDHGIQGDWRLVTGSPEDVERVLKAFGVWSGSKFNHKPVTLLHTPGSPDWRRLDGLGNGELLAKELRGLLNKGTTL